MSTMLARQWNRLLNTVLISRAESQRPLPPVRVALDRSIPAGALHAAIAATALVGVAALATNPAQWLLGIVAAAVIAVRPRVGLPQAYAAALGLGLALGPDHGWAARGFMLILVAHLLIQLGSIADNLRWGARVEVRVLTAPAGRFAVVQAFAQLLAVGAMALSERQLDSAAISIAAAASAALLAGALLAGARAPTGGGR